jgi:hypothetical protein
VSFVVELSGICHVSILQRILLFLTQLRCISPQEQ